MATKTTASPARVEVALPESLNLIASQVAGALQETVSLSVTLGDLAREAAKAIKTNADMVDPFVDACRQMCDACGLTEGSVKVYLSNMRGVLRAMAGGWKAPKGDMTLRAMYEAVPKGTGRQKATGARPTDGTKAAADGAETDEDDAGDAIAAPKALSKADAKKAAMVALFGHADDELLAALDWAAAHEMRFLNLVKSQIAFDSKPVAASLKQAA
jgi:hypothetical protein